MLDIRAYSKCKFDRVWDEEYYERNHDRLINVYRNADYDHGLSESEGLYTFDRSSHFKIGHYNAYNWWKERLSYLMLGVSPEEVVKNPDRYDGEPFYELINYSDCEGTFGTKTCAKLHRDFHDNMETVIEENDKNFTSGYMRRMKAFEMAKDGGFVQLS